MKDLKYQKNSLQYSYNSTETFDVKTSCKNNAKFIQIRVLSQLPFVQFKPCATFLVGLLLSLTLMSKSKKILETSLNLTPSFKTSVDEMVQGLVSNVNYLHSLRRNFIQKKQAETDVCCAHTFRYLDCDFSSCTDFLDHGRPLKVKK